MDIQVEKLSPELLSEASVLMHMHKDELCLHEDFVLDPDWEVYFKLAYQGSLIVYTARNDHEDLIGYSVFAIHQNLHYRQIRHAVQDVLFIHPSKRGKMAGVGLIKFADEDLAARGVNLVTHHVKVKADFGPLLERAGYQLAEKLYEKRLG